MLSKSSPAVDYAMLLTEVFLYEVTSLCARPCVICCMDFDVICQNFYTATNLKRSFPQHSS